jgi:serine kinase of HPr protein (carbohydrate metabolism regulator)
MGLIMARKKKRQQKKEKSKKVHEVVKMTEYDEMDQYVWESLCPGSIALNIYNAKFKNLEYPKNEENITIKTRKGTVRNFKFKFKWIDKENHIIEAYRKLGN